MASVEITIGIPGKNPYQGVIANGVYSIGSEDGCKIHLPDSSIDARHAVLTVNDDGCWIEDLNSHNGTLLGSEKVAGRSKIRPGQAVKIGPFVLSIGSASGPAEVPKPAEQPKPQPVAEPPAAKTPERPAPATQPVPGPDLTSAESETLKEIEVKRNIKQQIHKALVERMDIKRLASSRITPQELRQKAATTIREIVAEISHKLPRGISPEELVNDICDEALGLGPLEEFLRDDSITEIMVNGPSRIFVEKAGKLTLSGRAFMDEASVMAIIERIVSPLGRRIDESQPYVDARLPDGSRVNAIIHPLSLIGPCLTIRKFSKKPFTDQDLIRFGTMTKEMVDFIKICVLMRKNIIVSGGTGSGKTSLLNVLSNFLPSTDRIVTIEDAAELRLGQMHVVRLEARPPNIEGKGAITIRDLVKNSLRMRPDRVVVGECRGGETLDMLQAMNTGHDGSLTTAHSNSPRDTISRLETMVLMSGMDLPVRAIREQIASAVDLIVHESRFSDGSRKVTSITEIVGLEGEQITMQEIFEFKQTGLDENGKVLGKHLPTGSVPTFLEDIGARGMKIDHSIFDPQKWRN